MGTTVRTIERKIRMGKKIRKARIRAVRKIKKEGARMVKTRTRRNQTLNDEDGYELSLVLISNNHAISPSSVCLPCPFIIHMTWTKFRGRKIRKNKCVILLISIMHKYRFL